MTRYVARRLLGAIPLVLGIATILFFIVNLAPGDPALVYARPGMDQATMEQIRANFGLDRPIHVRYGRWLSRQWFRSMSTFSPTRSAVRCRRVSPNFSCRRAQRFGFIRLRLAK